MRTPFATEPLVGGFFLALLCLQWSAVVAPRQAAPRVRDPAALKQGPVEAKTRAERQSLLDAFEKWLLLKAPEHTLADMALNWPMHLSEWVETYILEFYVNGRTLRSASEVVNSLQASYRWLKGQLAGPRGLLFTWRNLEPPTSAPPISVLVVQSLVMTAVAWNWSGMALTLAVGFCALLRPIELTSLRADDFARFRERRDSMYYMVQIRSPKVRNRGARKQTVRLDARWIVNLLDSLLPNMEISMPLCPFSTATWRSRLRALLRAVDLPENKFLPSSLRTGGATALFRSSGENLQLVLWRGRWNHQKMLNIYIQELLAAEIAENTHTSKVRAMAALLLKWLACNDTE